jgi:hypothetical protein
MAFLCFSSNKAAALTAVGNFSFFIGHTSAYSKKSTELIFSLPCETTRLLPGDE